MKYMFSTLPDTAEVAEFNFDPFPRIIDEWGVFRVRVARMSENDDEWCIRRHLRYLSKADEYTNTLEWSTSYNTEINGFSLEEALAVAEELIWNIKVDGKTASDIIREHYPELESRIP